jgi:toxin secretion/phage lysis holin
MHDINSFKTVAILSVVGSILMHPLLAQPWAIYAVLAGIDVVAGLLYFGARRRLHSRSYTSGLMRKSLILLFIFGVAWLERTTLNASGLTSAVSLFYAIGELLSIAEKMTQLGAPMPKWLRERLAEYRKETMEGTPHEETKDTD